MYASDNEEKKAKMHQSDEETRGKSAELFVKNAGQNLSRSILRNQDYSNQ
jgi:hypothetical protein